MLVAGSEGNIGTIIKADLADVFDLKLIDSSPFAGITGASVLNMDLSGNCIGLSSAMVDMDAVIHLAWKSKTANWKSQAVSLEGIEVAQNILRAAVEVGVKRVVLASSIHADDWDKRHFENVLMDPHSTPTPRNPYGALKVAIEALGRYYAAHRYLDIVCIRFGGVHPRNEIRLEPGYRRIMLSRRDCASVIRHAVLAGRITGNFNLLNGVSNNTGRFHDWSNSIGWVPQDDCTMF